MMVFEGKVDLSAQFQRTGEEWVKAIVDGAVERLEQFCQPGVASQILTDRRYMEFDNPRDLVAKFRQWFSECSDFRVEQSRVEQVGDRLGIFYRFQLQEQGVEYVVEQQIYCTLQNGRISRLQLLCSGFQPTTASSAKSPARHALLEIRAVGVNNEATCAVLTPAIKNKLREIESGQVLEVRVNDPSAKGDVEAWCRLSGNTLLQMDDAGAAGLRFFIRKK